jgi:hypothetical protein
MHVNSEARKHVLKEYLLFRSDNVWSAHGTVYFSYKMDAISFDDRETVNAFFGIETAENLGLKIQQMQNNDTINILQPKLRFIAIREGPGSYARVLTPLFSRLWNVERVVLTGFSIINEQMSKYSKT